MWRKSLQHLSCVVNKKFSSCYNFHTSRIIQISSILPHTGKLSLSSVSVPNIYSHHIHSTHSFDPNPDSDGARIGEVVLTTKHGTDVLLDPLLNKGTGF